MEATESEAIFESLNLNPQLLINEVLNLIDDLVDGAFDFFQQESSALLKTEEGTDRADNLRKGVAYLHYMIQTALDKRMDMWEKYCMEHCFVVPQGFTLPKPVESSGVSSMDEATTFDPELEAVLDGLRDELTAVGKETAELNQELQALEKHYVESTRTVESIKEVFQLYEQNSMREKYEEMVRSASELRRSLEKVQSTQMEEDERLRLEQAYKPDNDVLTMNFSKGMFKARLKDLEAFGADLNNT